jgi:hypothetical protein
LFIVASEMRRMRTIQSFVSLCEKPSRKKNVALSVAMVLTDLLSAGAVAPFFTPPV